MKKDKIKKIEIKKLIINSLTTRFIYLLMLVIFCIYSIGCSASRLNNHPVSAKITGISFRPLSLNENSPNAFTYWVKKNDEVSIEYDSYRILWLEEDVDEGEINTCTFGELPDASAENVPDACGFLDFCKSEYGVDGLGLRLVADFDFIRSDNPDTVIYFFPNERFLRACSTSTEGIPPTLITLQSGLYRLKDAAEPGSIEIFEGVTGNETKIHALDNDQNKSQTVTFDLTKERIDAIDYWRWQMPDDPVWSHNFSKNVKVTNIRILENGNQVRPSRVLYLPQFEGQVSGHGQEMDNQCFVNANTPNDHTITLRECRKSPNANSAVETNKITTPVYTQNEPPDLLSWFVEFNTNQGGEDASSFGALQIEFTIEAN